MVAKLHIKCNVKIEWLNKIIVNWRNVVDWSEFHIVTKIYANTLRTNFTEQMWISYYFIWNKGMANEFPYVFSLVVTFI